jgi:hypothetical protein
MVLLLINNLIIQVINIMITISRWSTVLQDSLFSGPQPGTRLIKKTWPILTVGGNQPISHPYFPYRHPFSRRLMVQPGNTKGGSITVLLTSCLTGLESAV